MSEPQSRTEYRVVGENEAGEQWERPSMSLDEARRELKFLSIPWNRWVCIQKSEVTETRTPWEDVQDGE